MESRELLLTNLQILHADENFGKELGEDEKGILTEREIEFSFDEKRVGDICKWLNVWFENVVDRKVNNIRLIEIINKNKRDFGIFLNYNSYSFYSENLRNNIEVIDKIRSILK